MSQLTLLLAFHNHQPEGNFDDVFRRAYDDCYRPLLDALADHPRVRVTLHHTGPLLEWLDRNTPAYLSDLKSMVARGQVEVLGGAFYEPMLAVLPHKDAQGQLEMMSTFCAERFGQKPTGMWLAERVWEPALAETIARAGLRYTLLDDTHFRYAGHTGDLFGWYVTERAGHALALFPIDKELRYAIPFQDVDQAMQTLDGLLARGNGKDVVVTYGDDGEKFGLWPHTKEWVWGKGWLRRFLARLSETQHVVTSTFAEVLGKTPPSGRVYLPTASYEEMGEWTLPAEAQVRYHDLRARLEHEHRFEEIRPFFRGGVWQSFLAKYPEANLMHKKMVHVSRKLDLVGRDLPEARRELYRGQCNCAYWHGLFGGLYLNYLRHAVYSHLIAAETAAEEALVGGSEPNAGAEKVERFDFDGDLRDEVILSNRHLWVGIKPDAGGAFFELDARPQLFNLANVLGRHPEGYHGRLREAARAAQHGQSGGEGPKSIHDLSVVKDSGLEDLLHYDRHPRFGFIDHFLAPGASLDDLALSKHDERGDFAGGAYRIEATRPGREAVAELVREGAVRAGDGRSWAVTVRKRWALAGGRLSVRYAISTAGPDGGAGADERLDAWFAPELSLTLLAGDDPARRYEAPGLDGRAARMNSKGTLDGATELRLVDDWSRLMITLAAGGQPRSIWRFPLETASQSEGGFERTYQGSVLAAVYPISLAPGSGFETTLSLTVEERP